MQVDTVKIKSPISDDNPLGFIVINKSDLTEEHDLFEEESESDEPKAMTVAKIREALAAKNITIPDTVTKKADLQALLDSAPAA
jgi:hypothetical protein